MFNITRKCDRCGVSYDPNNGIYGARIEIINLFNNYFVNRQNSDVYHLCAKCRKEFIGLNEAFIKGKITSIMDESGNYTFSFVEEK